MRNFVLALLLCLASLPAAFALDSVPQAEYRQRREALAAKLHGGAAILFAASEPLLDFMPYRQDSDFYYLTGWNEPGAAIIIFGEGPATILPRIGTEVPAHTYREVLLLPARNLVIEKYTGIKLDASSPNAIATTGFQEVLPIAALPTVLTSFVSEDRRRAKTLWSQLDSEPAISALRFTAASIGSDQAFPTLDARTLTMDLRAVKTPAEIDLLRKASDASIAGQIAGMRRIKPGVTERAVAGTEIATFMADGCERPSYAPIVGTGANSTVLHYSSNAATMRKDDVVVIDAAGEFSMYASDITRTMPVGGHFTHRQRELYDIVLGAQQAAADAFKAGTSKLGNVNERGVDVHNTLDKVAYDYINTHGRDLHGSPLGKYFLHGLGHSVGIDVHDPMDYTKPLIAGNVFTIEPGIYIPEEQIGIRIEDVVYVDNDGRLVDLIAKLPHTAQEIEAAMRSK